jgi:predicted acetyltransferase
MGIEVRTITDDELEPWVAALRNGFLGFADPGEAEFRRPGTILDRTWGAFDGDKIVATLRSWDGEVTVPGGAIVPAAALTAVTVLSTHRRRGLMSQMLLSDLDHARELGEPLGMLIAAEWPIYGRFGYGRATETATWTIQTRNARFREPVDGEVELVSNAELRAIAPDVFDRHRRQSTGEIVRKERYWDPALGIVAFPGEPIKPSFCAVCRDRGGEPIGYLHYRIKNEWDERRPNSTLEVDELIGLTPAAEARLWRYACEVDWVVAVEAANRRVEEPLPFLLADGRGAYQTSRGDHLWVRLIDVPAALTARTYADAGAVVLEVIDATGMSSGRYRLEASPDGASCRRTTTDSADLTLPLESLGAAYLGGTSLCLLAAAGLVAEERSGALALTDRLLRADALPWCTTWF